MSRRDDVLKYFEREKDFINTVVEENIEKNRKGDAKVVITDKNGTPIKNAKIKIKQKNHEFKYGANIFMLDEMETEEKNNKYREAFKDAFNMATVPIYWSDLEPVQGMPRFSKDSEKIYRRPPLDLCLEYCEKYDIEPKAHCLTYVNFTPDWVDLDDVYDTKKKLETRYKVLAENYSDKIRGWEVINETLCYWNGSKEQNSKFFAMDDLVEWNFALAEKYFYNNHLIINEASHVWKYWHLNFSRSQYYMLIEKAMKNGARIDSVGLQFHIFCNREKEKDMAEHYYSAENIYRVLDQYAKLNKPIQLTEITIPAYSDDAEDEQIQAEIMENLYKIWFSHDSVEAAIYWNLTDGYAAFAPRGDMNAGENYYRGGLLRFDMSKKPAYKAIKNLFENVYRTNLELTTDEQGRSDFRGFYGKYELEITLENGESINKEIDLRKKCKNSFAITL